MRPTRIPGWCAAQKLRRPGAIDSLPQDLRLNTLTGIEDDIFCDCPDGICSTGYTSPLPAALQELSDGHYHDAPETCERQEMAITAQDDLRAGGDGPFEDAVIGPVRCDRVNGFGGRDERREKGDAPTPVSRVLRRPFQFGFENARDLVNDWLRDGELDPSVTTCQPTVRACGPS